MDSSANMGNLSHMQGVYRQRSYDNLQNGKSPFHRNSVRSLHLPPSASYGMSNYNSTNFYNNNNVLGKRLSLNNQHHQNSVAIPSNFKFVSPQSSSNENFDSNSLPRYPYHKNRAVRNIHHSNDGTCVVEYYRYGQIRHPLTPPPPPPKVISSPSEIDEQILLPTPTSSTSSGEHYSSNSEYDPMIAGSSKRVDHMVHYRTCKKQIQHATQQLFQPNPQHQMYIDNYFNHFTQHSPYKRHTSTRNHDLQGPSHVINMHQVYHNPNKRHSNIYEYHFSNFDLNSINEDGRHDS